MPQATSDFTNPGGQLPASLSSCGSGKIIAYFEDIDRGTGVGFDGPNGANAVNCVCSVIQYLESLFDLSNLSASDPVIIKFEAYDSNKAIFPGTARATDTPNYQIDYGDYEQSYMGNAIINGLSNVNSEYAGIIRINWRYESGFAFCGSGSSIGGCQEDFFHIVLHQFTHIMGFASAIEKSSWYGTLTNRLSSSPSVPQTFTMFDKRFLYYKDASGNLQKCVSGTAPTIALSYNYFTNKYALGGIWLNGYTLATRRTNHPIMDLPDVLHVLTTNMTTYNPSYNHFDPCFGGRSWESPGYELPYIMDWNVRPGYQMREYTKPELNVLTTLGYVPKSPTAYPWTFSYTTNIPPYVLKTYLHRPLSMLYNTLPYYDSLNWALTEAIPGNDTDLHIKTNTCTPVVINLNALSAGQSGRGTMSLSGSNTSQALHFMDDSSQTLQVYDGKLWPILGCSYNNRATNPLSLSGNIITYTPPKDFFGRAQFGFHLGDGIERGSFIVVTIEVAQDSCYIHDPCEMVLNGGFEEGTMYNSYDVATGSYSMPYTADKTSFMNNVIWDGYINPNCGGGQVIADGVEPIHYNQIESETVVVDFYAPTYCEGPYRSYAFGISPFHPMSSGCSPISHPAPPPTSSSHPNKRYLMEGGDTLGMFSHNFTLNHVMLPGALYKVEFDYNIGSTASFNFGVYFTDTLYRGNGFTFSSIPTTDKITGLPATATSSAWNHQSSTFTYSASASANNRFMRIGTGLYNIGFNVDNISLQRIVIPQVAHVRDCNLSTFTASVPGGAIISWQWYDAAGNAIPGATSPVFTTSINGSYTVKATDDNGCSGFSNPTVAQDSCTKFTTDMGATRPPIYLSGTITSLPPNPVTGTNYDRAFILCSNVTVASNITFDRDFVLARPNVGVTVQNGATLTVQASHIATCPDTKDMWQGITLGQDGSRVHVTNGSLIEDARTAIKLPTGVGLTPGNPIIETNDAIFNRNDTGISIQNFSSSHSQDFRFVKSVFTSRNLNQANDYKIWPSVATLLTAAPTNAPYPPYALAAPNAKPYYSPLLCKDSSIALTGMYFNNASLTSGGGGSLYSYQSILVGEDNNPSWRNMFDLLRAGIQAHNTSVTVRNTTFEWMKNTSKIGSYGAQGGVGIYAEAQAPHIKKLDVSDGAQVWHNEFYENRTGVVSWHFYNLQVKNCKISSSNIYGADPYKIPNLVGQNGVEVNNYVAYDLIEVSDNSIDAMFNSIVIANNVNWAKSGYTSQIRILGNQIALATKTGSAPNYKSQGILVNNLTKYSGVPKAFGTPAWVLVQNNTLNNAYNGISLSNFSSWTSVNSNIVNMQQADFSQIQYGIKTVNCNNQSVNDNTVTSTAITNDNARGIYTASSFAPNITCNTANTLGRGFEFYGGVQIRANWLKNMMSNNGKGFMLNSSDIGAQPYASSIVSPAQAASNRWTSGTWAAGTYHTYTFNSLPANSNLYILFGSTPDLVPTNNSGGFSFSPWIYDPIAFTGIQPATSLFSGACSPASYPLGSGGPSAGPSKAIALRIAQDSVQYGRAEARNAWMGQYQLFRALSGDSAFRNSDPILLSFYNTALGTRYDWLSQIEDSFAMGNDAAALALMGTPPAPAYNIPGPNGVVLKDGTAGDTLIDNYLAYYQLYAHWRSNNLTSSDYISLSLLAQRCPHIDGAAVYEARALKQVLTHDYTPYTNECAGSGGNARMLAEVKEQQYWLSPNPNDGTMQLHQSISNEQPVMITVYNVLGQAVSKTTLQFTGTLADLQLKDIVPGMYYLNLLESDGKVYTLKFLKQ